jgi:hypothetical protein
MQSIWWLQAQRMDSSKCMRELSDSKAGVVST